MNRQFKILAGVNNEGDFYFIEGEFKSYFSMSGFSVKPLRLEDAIEQSRQCILESVESQTEGINPLFVRDTEEIVDEIIDTDGELSGIDRSLYEDIIDVDGVEYVFESMGCGQHKEDVLQKYFIDETDYKILMSIWNKYHLKDISILNMNTEERAIIDRMLELGYYQDRHQNVEKLIADYIANDCYL